MHSIYDPALVLNSSFPPHYNCFKVLAYSDPRERKTPKQFLLFIEKENDYLVYLVYIIVCVCYLYRL